MCVTRGPTAPVSRGRDRQREAFLGRAEDLEGSGAVPGGPEQGAGSGSTGYAVSGGGFNNYLGGLRSRGFTAGGGEQLRVTEAGLEALGSWDPLPVGPELIDYWRRQLGKAERLILEALVNAYPLALSKADIAAQTAMSQAAAGSTTGWAACVHWN
jgi:uncharacterized protein